MITSPFFCTSDSVLCIQMVQTNIIIINQTKGGSENEISIIIQPKKLRLIHRLS